MKSEKNIIRYNHAEKIRTLRLLERNNFNYMQTSKQNGIARPTLKRWEKLYGKEAFSGKSPTEEALAEIDAELKHNDINIIRNLYTLRKQTLQRVMALTEKETRLESLLRVLQFASGELQKFSDLEKDEPDKSTEDYISYITKIMFGEKKDMSQIED
jgi:transposase-like protein